ncbi:hypothetical protein AVEN_18005-1 [Araneus ventricosus]|uniref:DDE-1 domain-containing protein n=1 Tax=Araneus ventricosus TaxID=182803 RepID=A0A4Y2X5L0_ARAVE|nr:hypothetical protein AVEN_18005-1 [Araneus ventricosus]
MSKRKCLSIKEKNSILHEVDKGVKKKAEFFVSNGNSVMWIQLREKEEINDDVLIDDFLSLDSEVETSETLTELDILKNVKNKNDTAMNCDEDEDDEDRNDHDAEINKLSYDEMLKSFETI